MKSLSTLSTLAIFSLFMLSTFFADAQSRKCFYCPTGYGSIGTFASPAYTLNILQDDLYRVGIRSQTTKNMATSVLAISQGPNSYGVRTEGEAMGLFSRNKGGTGYAGFFSGVVYISSTLINPSDKRLKKDILPINNALDAIMSVEGKTYTYKVDEHENMVLAKGQQMGYLAQDLEQVLPQLVSDNKMPVELDEEGRPLSAPRKEFKGINYIGMIPVITEAIKEQQQMIESQKTVIDNLETQVYALSTELSKLSQLAATGSLDQIKYLEQNQPNPFDVSTTIRYTLPERAQQSTLIIHDMLGKEVKKYPLNGNGELVIDGGSLEAGMYFYSLISDGVVISSLKMMLTK